MNEELLSLTHERREGQLLLELRGEIDLSNVDYVEQRVDFLTVGSSHVVLDLAGIDYMDSQGLRLLRQLSSRLAGDGVELQLVAPPGCFARGLLEMASIGDSIDVLDAPPG